MTWDSLSNDTRNATHETKPQSESVAVPPATDCGFEHLSMSLYANTRQRDFGPEASSGEYSGNTEWSQ